MILRFDVLLCAAFVSVCALADDNTEKYRGTKQPDHFSYVDPIYSDDGQPMGFNFGNGGGMKLPDGTQFNFGGGGGVYLGDSPKEQNHQDEEMIWRKRVNELNGESGEKDRRDSTKDNNDARMPSYNENASMPPYNENAGMPPYNKNAGVPPYHENAGMPPYENAGMPPYNEIAGMPPYNDDARMPSYNENAGMPPYNENAGMPPYNENAGMPSYNENAGILPYNENAGMPPYNENAGMPPYNENAGMPPYNENAGMPPYNENAGMPPYNENAGMPPYNEHAGMPPYNENAGMPPYNENAGLLSYSSMPRCDSTREGCGHVNRTNKTSDAFPEHGQLLAELAVEAFKKEFDVVELDTSPPPSSIMTPEPPCLDVHVVFLEGNACAEACIHPVLVKAASSKKLSGFIQGPCAEEWFESELSIVKTVEATAEARFRVLTFFRNDSHRAAFVNFEKAAKSQKTEDKEEFLRCCIAIGDLVTSSFTGFASRNALGSALNAVAPCLHLLPSGGVDDVHHHHDNNEDGKHHHHDNNEDDTHHHHDKEEDKHHHHNNDEDDKHHHNNDEDDKHHHNNDEDDKHHHNNNEDDKHHHNNEDDKHHHNNEEDKYNEDKEHNYDEKQRNDADNVLLLRHVIRPGANCLELAMHRSDHQAVKLALLLDSTHVFSYGGCKEVIPAENRHSPVVVYDKSDRSDLEIAHIQSIYLFRRDESLSPTALEQKIHIGKLLGGHSRSNSLPLRERGADGFDERWHLGFPISFPSGYFNVSSYDEAMTKFTEKCQLQGGCSDKLIETYIPSREKTAQPSEDIFLVDAQLSSQGSPTSMSGSIATQNSQKTPKHPEQRIDINRNSDILSNEQNFVPNIFDPHKFSGSLSCSFIICPPQRPVCRAGICIPSERVETDSMPQCRPSEHIVQSFPPKIASALESSKHTFPCPANMRCLPHCACKPAGQSENFLPVSAPLRRLSHRRVDHKHEDEIKRRSESPSECSCQSVCIPKQLVVM